MLELLLKSRNPEGYRRYQQYKNSGKNPDQIINELLQTGEINQDMINRAKNIMNSGNNDDIKRF